MRMNNLPEIKDIHIHDTVSMFPLAYGWWVILLLVVLLFFIIKLVLFIIKTSRKYYAFKELEKLDSLTEIEAIIGISNLLRRICSIKYKNATSLYGKDWIDFLTKNNNSLSKEASDLLIYAPFMNKDTTNYNSTNIKELKSFCKKWIGDNL